MTSLIIKSKIGLENYYHDKEDYYSDSGSDTDSDEDNDEDNNKEDDIEGPELPSGSGFTFEALPEYLTDNVNIDFPVTRLVFDKAKKLYTGNHTTVFRGELTAEDDSMKPLDVVIKIDMFHPHSEGLINEAKLYTTKLDTLQGRSIPLYYGIYQAKFGSDDVTCLVLQYCGKPVMKFFNNLDKKFKYVYLIRCTHMSPT